MNIALCIGTNYPGTSYELHGCVNDANNWAAYLGGHGYTVYAKLLDRQATKRNIVTAIGNAIATLTANDRFVMTFSGHGTRVPDRSKEESDGYDEALCPFDCDQYLILDDELKLLFAKCPAECYLLADSCHSATLESFIPNLDSLAVNPDAIPKFVDFDTVYNGKPIARYKPVNKYRGLCVLSGCAADEYSYDTVINGQPCGAFSAHALAVAHSIKRKIKWQQFHERLRRSLPSQEYPQTPQLTGDNALKQLYF